MLMLEAACLDFILMLRRTPILMGQVTSKAIQCAIKVQYNFWFVIARIHFHRCKGSFIFPTRIYSMLHNTYTTTTCNRLTVSLRNSPTPQTILNPLLEKVADKLFGGSIKVFVFELAVVL